MIGEHIKIEGLLSDGELVVPDLPEAEDEHLLNKNNITTGMDSF
jgi:hypothetical protein